MLYRIVMDIFNVPDKIGIISDLVFPVTPLPDCLLAFIEMGGRLTPLEFIPASTAEMALDLTPAHGEVVVISRQSP